MGLGITERGDDSRVTKIKRVRCRVFWRFFCRWRKSGEGPPHSRTLARIFSIEHAICLRDFPYELGVNSVWELSAPSPSIGIVEARDLQTRNRLCLRQAIAIADDGGTGHYFLLLAGEKRGSVFFVYLDDRPLLSLEDWESLEISVPEEMVEVSSTFDELGKLILDSRCEDGSS